MTEPASLYAAFEELLDGYVQSVDRHPLTRIGERDPISRAVRLAVYFRDGFACDWCDRGTDLELDHMTPWSAGGTDRTDNLRPLCHVCNTYRSNYPDVSEPRRIPCAYGCDTCDNDSWPPRQMKVFLDRFTPDEMRSYSLGWRAFWDGNRGEQARCYCLPCAAVSWCSTPGLIA